MSIRIVPLGPDAEPLLTPDVVWNGITGDYAPAGDDEPSNRGGLRAKAQLATAVLLCLMTDVAADPSELRDGDVNRGWTGDAFDIDTAAGEVQLGSKLWLLRRRAIDDVETPRLAEDYARQALQTLIDQGAVAAIDVEATADSVAHRLDLEVTLFDRSGSLIRSDRFAVLWEQIDGLERPLSV